MEIHIFVYIYVYRYETFGLCRILNLKYKHLYLCGPVNH